MTVRIGPAGPPIRANTMEPEVLRQAIAALVGQAGVVAAGDLAVAQSASPAMSVSVAAGVAIIEGTDVALIQGNYSFVNDGPVTVVIAAAHATLDRVDAVIAQIQDAFYAGASNTPQLVAVTGTPAGSPVVPALPTSSMLLATVAVVHASTSVLNANITDARQLTTAAVAAPYVRNAAAGPPGSPGTLQELADDNQGNLYEWNGAAWVPTANLSIFGVGFAEAGAAPPAASGRFLVQAGTFVATTNGSGVITITFPTFPNGLLSLVVGAGDNGYAMFCMCIAPGTASWQNVACNYTNTAAPIISHAVRVNWIAIGF